MDGPVVNRGPSLSIFCAPCKNYNGNKQRCPTCKTAVDKEAIQVEAAPPPVAPQQVQLKKIGAEQTELWLTPTTDGPMETKKTEDIRKLIDKK